MAPFTGSYVLWGMTRVSANRINPGGDTREDRNLPGIASREVRHLFARGTWELAKRGAKWCLIDPLCIIPEIQEIGRTRARGTPAQGWSGASLCNQKLKDVPMKTRPNTQSYAPEPRSGQNFFSCAFSSGICTGPVHMQLTFANRLKKRIRRRLPSGGSLR